MIEFHWGTRDGRNESFFPHQPGTAGTFYWPSTGALIGGELFIFCYSVDGTAGAPEAFPDTALIRIPNPQDPPVQWIKQVVDLGLGGAHQGFHSTVFVEESWAYFLGFDDPDDDSGRRRAVLARARTSDLLAGGIGRVFEFWVESPEGATWGGAPEKLVTLFSPGVTETAIHYEPQWGLYICPIHDSSPNIYITTAPKLTGPWSPPACIYRVPEHQVSFPVNSYAVKAHPELSTRPGELILTYQTNALGDIEPLFTEEGLAIYFPRFLRVQLELG